MDCQDAAGGETCDEAAAFRHEVSRLGFDLSGSWRISSLNKDLQFCPTYPPDILIPACISDQVLEKVASFRSAKRIPAVVWRHTCVFFPDFMMRQVVCMTFYALQNAFAEPHN